MIECNQVHKYTKEKSLFRSFLLGECDSDLLDHFENCSNCEKLYAHLVEKLLDDEKDTISYISKVAEEALDKNRNSLFESPNQYKQE